MTSLWLYSRTDRVARKHAERARKLGKESAETVEQSRVKQEESRRWGTDDFLRENLCHFIFLVEIQYLL